MVSGVVFRLQGWLEWVVTSIVGARHWKCRLHHVAFRYRFRDGGIQCIGELKTYCSECCECWMRILNNYSRGTEFIHVERPTSASWITRNSRNGVKSGRTSGFVYEEGWASMWKISCAQWLKVPLFYVLESKYWNGRSVSYNTRRQFKQSPSLKQRCWVFVHANWLKWPLEASNKHYSVV